VSARSSNGSVELCDVIGDVQVATVEGRPVWGSCVTAQTARGATKQAALDQCIGFELMAIEAEGAPLPSPRTPRCFVVAIGADAETAGRYLIADLRDEGIAAAGSHEDRPLKAQLKMADRAGASFAAIVGERELADGTVTLRRLADGVQMSVPTADVARWLTTPDGWADRP